MTRDPREASPLLLVLSAPSGGGKTTVCQRLLAADPRLMRAVTCTTRAPRPGEQPGWDYHYLAAAEFERRVQAGQFLEQATVYGRRYGTLRSELLEALERGRDVLLAIDVQGAASIRTQAAQDPQLRRALVTVFLTPPSLEVLAERLRSRGTDTLEAQQRRLDKARGEIAHWPAFDYLVLSHSMEEDVERMRAIIAAERMRSRRQGAGWLDQA